MSEIYTIGHSNLAIDAFLHTLKAWRISAVADVRSVPWSKRNPQFNKDNIRLELEHNAIVYRFLGHSLGGRPRDATLFTDGVADYEKMATTAFFREGLTRVHSAAAKHKLALMCSEHDPIDCHRCLLVGRKLSEAGIDVRHILSAEQLQTQVEVERRMMKATGNLQDDFLAPVDEPLEVSYREWSSRVAFALRQPASEPLGDWNDD